VSAIGKRYRYVSRTGRVPWREGESPRHGQVVTVLVWRRSKAKVQFPDGLIAICPGRCLRRLR